jgi:hypothetical protein
MGRKKVEKKPKGKEKKVPASMEKETEKTFDFGGLPERSLKKNLGCG